jgi:hypothetical protein
MNTHPWQWIALGCVLTVIVLLVIRYLLKFRSPYPEDVFMLSRPVDWDNVTTIFDIHNAESEAVGRPKRVSLQLLLTRLIASYEYFTRMMYNASLIVWCGERDKLAAEKSSNLIAQEEASFTAQSMLLAAESCEADAKLPEYQSQADDLLYRAADLRKEAQAQFLLAEEARSQNEAQLVLVDDALLSARRFKKAVRLQLAKIMCLIVLLRLDKVGLLPVRSVIRLWHSGNADLLSLYTETRQKAAAYISRSETGRELLSNM